ncbi:MAG: PIG-L deacetylase family protein, partial [Deltaproteobacteria bacterium]
MKRLNLTLIIWLILNAAWAYAASSALPAKPPAIPDLEPITQNDRILILAPHPDDEAIACAGLIQNAVAAGAQVHVVYLTNGDSNQLAFIIYEKRLTFRKGEFIHMGEVRRAEAVKAMQSLGLKESDLTFLGYPDFGSFAIFTSHWQGAKPFKSLLTRVTSVPYKTNLSFGAPYKGESVLKDLESLIRKYQPSKIFVSHPADTNADHKALYLFLQVALSDLSGKFPEPKVYPYLVHCVKWPSPRRYHPELWLSPPEQLMDSQVKWFRYILSRQQLDKKHKTILLYKSQTESSAFYLLAFARGNELFGDYPSVELKLPDVTSGAGAVNKPPPFLGLSNIYRDAEVSSLANLDRIIAASGSVSYALEN